MKRTLVFKSEDYDKFDQIRTGKKSVETRAGTELYSKISPGDSLLFKCRGEHVEKKVMKVVHFKNVEEAYSSGDFSKILPGVTSLEEAQRTYYGFSGYEEKIKANGLLAFYLV